MEKHEKLLNMIMDFNKDVRFAAVVGENGDILWHSQREGIKRQVPFEDTKRTILRSIEGWKNNVSMSKFAGNGLYTISSYEKIKRITVPLGGGHLLFLTMDNIPEIKAKNKSYGRWAQMGEILSIVDFIKSQK